VTWPRRLIVIAALAMIWGLAFGWDHAVALAAGAAFAGTWLATMDWRVGQKRNRSGVSN
jgi:hypothetical protein